MSNRTPKILIISETFKSNTGGGITLTNLFKGYPKYNLANAVDANELVKINSDAICDNFYSLGSEEKKVIKLFSFLQKKCFSGKYVYRENNLKPREYYHKSVRDILVNLFFNFLHFLGIYHLLYNYEISNGFKKWVYEFNPDYIYTQLSSRELIHFTDKLINMTGASLAIHIMDDWPSTISKNGLFKKYWKKKIDSEFRKLLDKADVLMSISEGMSIEYKKRYDKFFIPFHNPIEVDQWAPFSKLNLAVDPQNIKILYAGRIGLGTSDSIIEIAQIIDQIKKEGYRISFHIQTTTRNTPILEKLKAFSCVIFNPIVQYSELPKIFSSADILVMPIDFSKKGIQFLKYSMPTKVSEYMISGSPILLYCHPEVSLYSHAKKYEWAVTVSDKTETLKNVIKDLIFNIDLRTKISKTATEFAKNKFDSTKVRNEFMFQFYKNS